MKYTFSGISGLLVRRKNGTRVPFVLKQTQWQVWWDGAYCIGRVGHPHLRFKSIVTALAYAKAVSNFLPMVRGDVCFEDAYRKVCKFKSNRLVSHDESHLRAVPGFRATAHPSK